MNSSFWKKVTNGGLSSIPGQLTLLRVDQRSAVDCDWLLILIKNCQKRLFYNSRLDNCLIWIKVEHKQKNLHYSVGRAARLPAVSPDRTGCVRSGRRGGAARSRQRCALVAPPQRAPGAPPRASIPSTPLRVLLCCRATICKRNIS